VKIIFSSLTYPDLKLTDGKSVVVVFHDGVFETDNPKVIDYLRKCKAECVEIKPPKETACAGAKDEAKTKTEAKGKAVNADRTKDDLVGKPEPKAQEKTGI